MELHVVKKCLVKHCYFAVVMSRLSGLFHRLYLDCPKIEKM